jgi:hypothetical protein
VDKIQTLKRIIAASLMVLLMGCAPTLLSSSGTPVKAIYLVQGTGQLPRQDLQAHPEVLVTDDFGESKSLARSKVALWIDVDAAGLVDRYWLSASPQAFYPVVLVGNGSEACSFFNTLQYFRFRTSPIGLQFAAPGIQHKHPNQSIGWIHARLSTDPHCGKHS